MKIDSSRAQAIQNMEPGSIMEFSPTMNPATFVIPCSDPGYTVSFCWSNGKDGELREYDRSGEYHLLAFRVEIFTDGPSTYTKISPITFEDRANEAWIVSAGGGIWFGEYGSHYTEPSLNKYIERAVEVLEEGLEDAIQKSK